MLVIIYPFYFMIKGHYKLILGLVLAVVVVGCAKISPPPEKIYGQEELKAYFGSGSFWVPNATEAAEAKAATIAVIKSGAFPGPSQKIKSRIDDFALTFYGMTKNGERIVAVSGDSEWKKEGHPLPPNTLMTGASDTFFQAFYSINQKKVRGFP
jgi:hypothetical protein